MPRVLVVGAMGRMGERVRVAISEAPKLELGAALEAPGHPAVGKPIAKGIEISDDPKAALSQCEVAIDFTTPEATLQVMRAAADAGVAYVCGTTGFSDAQRAEIGDLAARIPIVHAPNFSVSVNILSWLIREAARKLGSGYDAELVEIHHSDKRDAPSGTALHLAEAVAAGRGQKLADHLVLERAGDIGVRPEDAIGIQTLRAGDIAGEHTVLFVGQGERLELTHRASTRDHFARGAVRTADWLTGRDPGLYPIERVFGLETD
ncbi:MAG: 4-hydroxy-tetrahydrodipicolinate reductase [Deltaproteobacteria bacterium]|nr:4-hydroxy-tetrahydrodipicolinate reductase [Deltaproteobacteria bacterium]MBW2693448.1 4-hydroxy-tetrahydrodipicolinate reductase [Deltaproteobacteria bacterium]